MEVNHTHDRPASTSEYVYIPLVLEVMAAMVHRHTL